MQTRSSLVGLNIQSSRVRVLCSLPFMITTHLQLFTHRKRIAARDGWKELPCRYLRSYIIYGFKPIRFHVFLFDG